LKAADFETEANTLSLHS